MKNYFKTAVLLLTFAQISAQNLSILDKSTRWILVNNKIEKNEIFLTSYKLSKLKANTLVMSFDDNKIVYDYESNPHVPFIAGVNFLDLDTRECSWKFDSLSSTLTLTIKGGYKSVDEFKFIREYKIDAVNDGFILMKTKEISYENLKSVSVPNTFIPIAKSTVEPKKEPIAKDVVVRAPKTKEIARNVEATTYVTSISNNLEVTNIEKSVVVVEPVKINYFAQYKDLFDVTKRWILVRNKIERGDIYLTPYDESKLSINNLVLTLTNDGKIEYEYESDPKIRICLGVDFLDIDTDDTTWKFDGENNIFTLTLKGGYASLDDFKFKRDYKVELFDDGFALRKTKEHYFNDFRKIEKKKK